MKKILSFLSCLIIVFSIIVAGVGNIFASKGDVAYASSVNSAILDLLPVTEDFLLDDKITIDENALNNYGLSVNQISDFTPYESTNNANRLAGKSVNLAMLGEGSANKYINQTVDLSSVVYGNNVSSYDESKMYLSIWLHFSVTNLRELTIEFVGENDFSFGWSFSSGELGDILAKDKLGYFDKSIYGSVAPYGWNMFVLPFPTDGVDIVNDSSGEFNFNALKIYQDGSLQSAGECPIYMYNPRICLNTEASAIVNPAVWEKQDFVTIFYGNGKSPSVMNSCLDGFDFSYSLDKCYYEQERIVFPSIFEVFDVFYVGDVNYLQNQTFVDSNFMYRVNGNNVALGANNVAFRSGENFLQVRALIGKGSSAYYVNIGEEFVINAKDYGTGVWFSSGSKTVTVGEVYEFKYVVDPAFNGALLTITSSDENILKIVAIDSATNTIRVEALKRGSATINMSIEHTRVDNLVDSNSKLDENGNFKSVKMTITVENEKKEANKLKILMWVSFALIVGYFIYYFVRTIIKDRRREVK